MRFYIAHKISLIFTALFFFSAIDAKALTLTIAYENNEQPPYYLGVSNTVPEKKPGIAVEMIKHIEKIVDGVEIKFARMPWKKCLKELELNKVQGIFNSSYKKSRLKAGWYPTLNKKIEGPVDTSCRITTISYSLYTLKGANLGWKGNNYDILKGTVGAPFGFSIVDDLQNKGINVKEAYNTDINFRALLNRRVIAVALQSVTGDARLKEKRVKYFKIEKLEPPLKTKHYYLMLSKKFVKENSELARQIWDSIKFIRKNKFDEFSAKYK